MKLHPLEMLVEEEEEDSYQPVIIVESLVISALNAIGHDEWEVTLYLLPHNIPNRVNDYGLDIRGDQGVPPENQASTSCGHVDVVQIENKEADMMPLGKRERTQNGAGPSKKKGKEKEGEDAKEKRKRRPRRKFKVADLPLGEGR